MQALPIASEIALCLKRYLTLKNHFADIFQILARLLFIYRCFALFTSLPPKNVGQASGRYEIPLLRDT